MTSTSPRLARQPAAARPVVTVGGAADLVATVPHLFGFHPAASLVVLGLRPPRSRVGGGMRVDLVGPPGGQLSDRGLAEHVSRVLRGTFTESLVVVYGDEPGRSPGGPLLLPHRRLVLEVDRAMSGRGAPVRESVLVAAGRWWSYDCSLSSCCPAEGTPVGGQEAPSSLATQLAVELGAPLPSRDAVVASLAATVPLLFPAEIDAALDRCDRLPVEDLLACVRRRQQSVLDRGPGAEATRAEAAELIALVQHVLVRDEVITEIAPADLDAAVLLWSQLLRWAPPGTVSQTGAVLAGLAHAAGEGVLALTAVERALAADPGHRLALLQLQCLQNGIGPAELAPPRRERRDRH